MTDYDREENCLQCICFLPKKLAMARLALKIEQDLLSEYLLSEHLEREAYGVIDLEVQSRIYIRAETNLEKKTNRLLENSKYRQEFSYI